MLVEGWVSGGWQGKSRQNAWNQANQGGGGDGRQRERDTRITLRRELCDLSKWWGGIMATKRQKWGKNEAGSTLRGLWWTVVLSMGQVKVITVIHLHL